MSETLAQKMMRLANEKVDHQNREKAKQDDAFKAERDRLAADDAVHLRKEIAKLAETFGDKIEEILAQHVHPSNVALTFSVIGLFQGDEGELLKELRPLFDAIEKEDMQPFILRQGSSHGCYLRDSTSTIGKVWGGPGRHERWDNELAKGGFLRLTSHTPNPPHDPPTEFGWLPPAQYTYKAKFGTATVAVGVRWGKAPLR